MPTHFLVFYINCYIHQRKHMIFVVLDWRISLSIMISSCIHFVTKDNLSWIGLGSRCSEWQPSNTLFVCFPPFLVSLACLPIPFPGTLTPLPHNCHAPSSQVLLERAEMKLQSPTPPGHKPLCMIPLWQRHCHVLTNWRSLNSSHPCRLTSVNANDSSSH